MHISTHMGIQRSVAYLGYRAVGPSAISYPPVGPSDSARPYRPPATPRPRSPIAVSVIPRLVYENGPEP